MTIWKRIRQWRRRREFEAGLEEEMRFHREMAGGAAFGSTAMAMEDSRAVWRFGWLESAVQDIRYAARGFRKSPGFALLVVGTIGVALGLNTTLFTAFNAYVLRPFAVREPWSLYSVLDWYGNNGQGHAFTVAQYEDLSARRSPFSEVLATENMLADVEGRSLFGQMVSGNYFTMLGAGMAAGRPVLPRDGQEGDAGRVMVIGYEAWQNKFGGDPNLVGRTVHVRGLAFEVVGIAGPAFAGLQNLPCGFWIPLAVREHDQLSRQSAGLKLVGRLPDGVRLETAKAELTAWSSGFGANLPREERPLGVAIESSATSVALTHDAVLTFLPIFVVFGLVLVIACANVSNMMLARALARQREIGIRVALGAGRARLVRQLLTESMLLAAPAAAVGFAISQGTVEAARRALYATAPAAFARFVALPALNADWRVFGFITAASVMATLVFGLAPAIQTTRSRLVEANRVDFSSDYRPARLRSVLLATQVAVCSLLLIVTAVVLRSQQRVTARSIGMDLNGVWDVKMNEGYRTRAAERLAMTPGVEAVAVAWYAPLYDGSFRQLTVAPGGGQSTLRLGYNLVSPAYLSVFRIPILRGRGFTEAEAAAEAPVAVVSESAARRLWPEGDAIGQTISIARETHKKWAVDREPAYSTARVIGVAGNVLSAYLAMSAEREGAMIYFPTNARAAGNESVLVRMTGAPRSARQRITKTLDGIARSIYDMINSMDDVLALQIYPFQMTFWIAAFLGGMALVMTGSGIYGVMSYLVNQRTKEIGIRVALGAGLGDVVRMVVRQSARLALIGTAAGVGVTLLIAPVFAHEIEAIRPFDAVAYGGAVLLVMAAALAAAWAPSRRAARVDPMTALRCD